MEMNQSLADSRIVTQICLLAGKIILQNGGETHRVEDTMIRIAAAYGIDGSHSFVTPTGLIFAIEGEYRETRLIRISERSNNLVKVSNVNDISRRISNGELTAEEAYKQLCELDAAPFHYSGPIKVLAAAAASGCYLLMAQGGWQDFLSVLLIGGLGYLFFILMHRFIQIQFFSEFLTALFIGSLAVLAVELEFGQQLDKIIIGSVIPLVPGLHITNAVRDLMAGHLVSGLSKGAEAFLTATAIGAGIAAVLSIL